MYIVCYEYFIRYGIAFDNFKPNFGEQFKTSNLMKVIAINGSPNKEGNTFHALKMVGDELEAEELNLKFCISDIN